jgi:hypothetical protein
MTEADWNSCTDPQVMLEFLRDSNRLSERKARLFGCACCRRIWRLLHRGQSRRAVEEAERYADGLVDEAALLDIDTTATAGADEDGPDRYRAAVAARISARVSPMPSAVADFAQRAVTCEPGSGHYLASFRQERAAQGALLRDLFGPLPFREVHIDPTWLRWNDGAVLRLATAIYEERQLPSGTLDNGRVAILADALLDAGCDNEEVLGHCRQQGEVHVRGCWVIDLLLGKK